MKAILEQMKALNAEIENLSTSKNEEKEEAKKAVIVDMISAKTVEFKALEVQAKELEEKAARDAKVADLEAKSTEVVSKTEELTDPKEEGKVTSGDNSENELKAKNDFSSAYLSCASVDVFMATASRDQGVLLNEQTLKDANGKLDAKNAVKVPSYMNDVIFGNMDIRAKASNQPVYVKDPSGTLSGGGSLVPTLFVNELYRLPKLPDAIWRLCWTKSAGKDADFPRLEQGTNPYGVAVAWGVEGVAINQDDPEFNILNISTQRLAGLTQVSLKELRNNGVGYEAQLAWMFTGAFDRATDTAILENTVGDNRPIGINTGGQVTLGVAVQTRETAAQISFVDLVGMQNKVENALGEDGVFVFSVGSNGAWQYVSSLDDTDGRPVMRQLDSWVASGLIPKVAGSDYIRSAANTMTLGQRGDVIYSGDKFRSYGLVVDNSPTGGAAIERSDHYAFNTGRVTFRVIGYVGGQPLGPGTFSLLGDVAAASSSSSSST